jgi:lysyl-tRNA synthetase class I
MAQKSITGISPETKERWNQVKADYAAVNAHELQKALDAGTITPEYYATYLTITNDRFLEELINEFDIFERIDEILAAEQEEADEEAQPTPHPSKPRGPVTIPIHSPYYKPPKEGE